MDSRITPVTLWLGPRQADLLLGFRLPAVAKLDFEIQRGKWLQTGPAGTDLCLVLCPKFTWSNVNHLKQTGWCGCRVSLPFSWAETWIKSSSYTFPYHPHIENKQFVVETRAGSGYIGKIQAVRCVCRCFHL